MHEAEIAQSIVDRCSDVEGFLVKLHTFRHFDEQRYDEMMDLIRIYADTIATSRMMDRRVAGCLSELESQLLQYITDYQSATYIMPSMQQIMYAFNEISTLKTRIFWM